MTCSSLVSMDVAHCYLEGNADAVEFCPHNGHHNVLAASTYTLQEGDQPTRCGSISLFNVDGDTDSFETVYSEETSGIFDIKWNPPSGNTSPFLGQADADGYLRIKMLDGCCDGVQGIDLYLDSFIYITTMSKNTFFSTYPVFSNSDFSLSKFKQITRVLKTVAVA